VLAHSRFDRAETGPHPGPPVFKKTLGLKWRCQGAIPLPPKKTIQEHITAQAEFLEEKLEPALVSVRAGEGHVFFVDAAHFVMGSFLACVWCVARIMIRGGCGRQRYNVLGAWNAMTNELVRVTNATVVNSQTIAELLHKIASLGLIGPITLVLDNARYQHCVFVKELAATLNIRLLFLPGYSPNLNLIERLWKFTKNKALYGHHFKTFDAFQEAIDKCLDRVSTEHRAALKLLMTHHFQTFDKASFLAA